MLQIKQLLNRFHIRNCSSLYSSLNNKLKNINQNQSSSNYDHLSMCNRQLNTIVSLSNSSSWILSTKLYDNYNEKFPNILNIQKRFYKKKKGGKRSSSSKKDDDDDDESDGDNDDDNDDEDDDDDEKSSDDLDTRIMNTTVASLRLDSIGKTCFNISRAKFEESFYNDLIRVNGERVAKKSYDVRENDEIDFIRGFNIDQRERLDINRVNILKLDDKAASSGRYRLQYRKTNKLIIDNYERDPYEGPLS